MAIATIYDVARESGFSIKTVSRVINGAANVRPDTAASVRDAIERLDYHPNTAARRLGGAASDTIAVVVDSLSDPFFAELISVIEQRAMEQDLDVVVASSQMDPDRANAQIRRLVRRGIDGLLLAPLGDEGPSEATLLTDCPLVVIDRDEGFEAYDSVRVTDEQGATEAVRHLLRYRHQRIAFIGDNSFRTVRDRLVGYRSVLAGAGIPLEPDLIDATSWTSEQAERSVQLMLALPHPPTAIFAATPNVGQGVLLAQRRLVRPDLALVVFGDFPFAELMSPGTTVIDQKPSAQGHAAMDLLLRRLAEPARSPVSILLATTLVARGSGELVPSQTST